MKPKQVDEQHKSLFSPEHNYNHKVIVRRKREEGDKLADKEIEQFLRETHHDTEGI